MGSRSSMRIVPKIHPEEFHITVGLVQHLLNTQVPWLSQHTLRAIIPGGTDHVMVRIGDLYVARLPRHPGAIPGAAIERKWLPIIASTLSTSMPIMIHEGRPDAQYAAPWSVLSWLPGKGAAPLTSGFPPEAALGLAREIGAFVRDLRSVQPPTNPPTQELPTSYRTKSLSARTSFLLAAIDECEDVFDRSAVLKAWTADKAAGGEYQGPSVAVHGDLQPSNILTDHDSNRLAGVLDWGGFSFGDPAVDLLPAWMLFDKTSRPTFRSACNADETLWRRGRAWALSIGIIAYPYYRRSRPDHAAMSRHQVEQVLEDVQATA